MRTLIVLLVAACWLAPAAAQNADPVVPGKEQVAPPLDQKACRDRMTPRDTIENEGAAPPDEDASDKLARNEGVICPPSDIDPDIRAPAPKHDAPMPVIPPPGGPGGDPAVRPK